MNTGTTSTALGRLEACVGGWRFPAFMISGLVLFAAMLLAVLAVPVADEGLGAFAADFKTWCFGYDPETGELEPIYVVMLIVNPLMLIAVILGVWWVPLRQALALDKRAFAMPAALAAALVCTAGFGLVVMQSTPTAAQDFPFPAEALRTTLPAPALRLTDHHGDTVDLAELRGHVVMLTAVYASCGFT